MRTEKIEIEMGKIIELFQTLARVQESKKGNKLQQLRKEGICNGLQDAISHLGLDILHEKFLNNTNK
jgi:hypothetical protein